MDLYENVMPKPQVQVGFVTAFGLVFAWFILGRLVDLLLELMWMVWIGIAVSASCYLPTVWVFKRTNRVKLKDIVSKNLTAIDSSNNEMYRRISEKSSETVVTYTETPGNDNLSHEDTEVHKMIYESKCIDLINNINNAVAQGSKPESKIL